MKHTRVKFVPVVLAVIVAFVVGTFVGDEYLGGKQPKASQASQKTATVTPHPPTRAQLLKLVNAERAKHGVAPLKESPMLDWSAQAKAEAEVKHHHFGHMYKGVFVGQKFINTTGLTCKLDAENLHWGTGRYITASAAVNWWMHSKPHRRAMLNPKYTLTGFGIALDKSNGHEQLAEHFCQTP
jgi:uncharacterized protein YkwD